MSPVLAVKRHPVLVALVGLLAANAVAVWLVHLSRTYEGTAEILVTPLPDDSRADRSLPLLRTSRDPTRIAQMAASLVDSRAAARLTARQMGPGWTPDRVAAAVAVEPVGQSHLLAVTARDDDPGVAARLANVFALAALEARATALRARVASLIARLRVELRAQPNRKSSAAVRLAERIRALRAMRGPDPVFSLSRGAEARGSPVGPPRGLLVVLAYVAGLVVGVGSALAVELLRPLRLGEWTRVGARGSLPAQVLMRGRRRPSPRARSRSALALPFAAAACGVAVIVFAPGSPARVIAGIALVLVLPGAALGRAVLARGEPVPERIAVALGASAIVVTLAALVLDVVRLPLEASVWVLVLVMLTGVAATVGYLRGLPERARKLRLTRPRGTDALLVGLSLALIAGALVLGATPLPAPRATPGSTALWIEASGRGGASAIARSDELRRSSYELAVTIDGRKVAASTFRLDPGEQYRVAVPSALKAGARIEALLYRLDGRPRLYRRAELTIGRNSPGATAPIGP
jgi:capsular polysaccharide biosynthesis protein